MNRKMTILLITCCSYAHLASAQAIDEVVPEKPKRFSMGFQAMMMKTPNGGFRTDIHDFGGGVYARYFFNKRWAASAQVNVLQSGVSNFNTLSGNQRLQRNGFEVPVQVEYHLAPDSKVRPYFGLGGGMTSFNTSLASPDASQSSFKYSRSAFVQLTYGIACNIGKKKVLNTSLFYRYNADTKQSSIGLNFGMGWRK